MILILSEDKKNKKRNGNLYFEYKIFFKMNKNEWFKSEEIEEILGCSKTTRTYVNLLRNDGLPIISSQKGYKLTTNKEEIKECYNQLRNRALKTITAAKNMKKYI